MLESAINAAQPGRVTSVLSSLAEVATSQPKLFKPVLPQVVEGMSHLAANAGLEPEARLSCVELLLTLAEGAAKM